MAKTKLVCNLSSAEHFEYPQHQGHVVLWNTGETRPMNGKKYYLCKPVDRSAGTQTLILGSERVLLVEKAGA